MPRLYVSRHGYAYRYLDAASAEQPVTGLRLLARVAIGRDPVPPAPDARPARYMTLDTGAYLSIFPYCVWDNFVGEIEWLIRSPAAPAPTIPLPTAYPTNFPPISNLDQIARGPSTILDGPFPALLGRVWIGVRDQENNTLPAVPVTALFRLDFGSKFKQPVLGLNAGLLDGRRLIRDTMAGKNRPMERLRHPDDFGPDHDQIWHLSQP